MPKIGNMTPLAEATLASPTVEIRMTRQEQLAELAQEPDEKAASQAASAERKHAGSGAALGKS